MPQLEGQRVVKRGRAVVAAGWEVERRGGFDPVYAMMEYRESGENDGRRW